MACISTKISSLHFLPENKHWNIIEDTGFNGEDETIQYAKTLLDMNQSFNINARAGTGKTYLLNTLMKLITENDKQFKTMAPTNIAASLIGGKSMHHFFLHNYIRSRPNFNNIDYIIVDEISMAIEIFYRFMISIKENNPKLKFIICGDFDQLPPINDYKNYNYKNSLVLNRLCDNNRVVLSECRRADNTLFRLCETLDVKNCKDILKSKYTNCHIVATNKKRVEMNNFVINRLISKNRIRNTYNIQKNESNKYTQDMKIFKNMKLISTKNCKKVDVINSDRYTISNIDNANKIVTVVDDSNPNKTLDLPYKEFSYIFVPAYALTVHKCQGQTISTKYTIHQWERFTNKMKYVALSRATNINCINII